MEFGSKTAACLLMLNVAESSSAGDLAVSEVDLEVEAIPKPCLHDRLDRAGSLLLLLGLVGSVEVSEVGLAIVVVVSVAASVVVIEVVMAEEEEVSATKVVEALGEVEGVVSAEHPMASQTGRHHLPTHRPVQVEAEAVFLVGMVADLTVDHQQTAVQTAQLQRQKLSTAVGTEIRDEMTHMTTGLLIAEPVAVADMVIGVTAAQEVSLEATANR